MDPFEAAAKNFEDRVEALERKMDTTQKFMLFIAIGLVLVFVL